MGEMRSRQVIGLLLALMSISMPAWAEKRVALVIGNATYLKTATLPNPKNDALGMAELLRKAGFDAVEVRTDLSADATRRVLRDFTEQVRDADVAIVFYAGHGMELNGVNYLIPVDATLARDVDVEDEAISLDRVIRTIEPARRLQLVILDACRDNPFVRSMHRTFVSRSVRSGHGDIDERTLPPNTLIAYAQKAGMTAEDGDSTNSPYTTALLKHLTTPGLDVELALRRVRDEVLKATHNRQEPFKYGSLGGSELPLVPAEGTPAALPSAPPPPQIKLEADRQSVAMLQQNEEKKRLQTCKDLVFVGYSHLGDDKPITMQRQAIMELEQAVSACDSGGTKPWRFKAHNDLAVAYALLGQWEDARTHFHRAIDLSAGSGFPGSTQAIPYEGLAYVGAHRNPGYAWNAEARASFSKVRELCPTCYPAHMKTTNKGPLQIWSVLPDHNLPGDE